MFDEIPVSTIKLPEGRFQTFLDISLSEELDILDCDRVAINQTPNMTASPYIFIHVYTRTIK